MPMTMSYDSIMFWNTMATSPDAPSERFEDRSALLNQFTRQHKYLIKPKRRIQAGHLDPTRWMLRGTLEAC